MCGSNLGVVEHFTPQYSICKPAARDFMNNNEISEVSWGVCTTANLNHTLGDDFDAFLRILCSSAWGQQWNVATPDDRLSLKFWSRQGNFSRNCQKTPAPHHIKFSRSLIAFHRDGIFTCQARRTMSFDRFWPLCEGDTPTLNLVVLIPSNVRTHINSVLFICFAKMLKSQRQRSVYN